MAFAIKSGLASEQGKRMKNDDCARMVRSSCLFVVSDGIGGAPDGDVMSRVGCGAALEEFELSQGVTEALLSANDAAVRVSEWMSSPYSGATLLVAALQDENLNIAWVGDSMAYRLRGGVLEALTFPDRADGNRLASAIGYSYDLAPNTVACDVAPGDRFLLCTDGVWEVYESQLGQKALVDQLTGSDNAPMIARMICQQAAEAGTDNATALVVIVMDPEETRLG